MDNRERYPDLVELLRLVQDDLQARIRTVVPGIIESISLRTLANPNGTNTCTVQPALKARAQDQNGEWQLVNLPLLLDVPVFFYGAGGCSLTMTPVTGDECEIHFTERGMDYFWQNGGLQPPATWRMHHLSDAIAVVGSLSQPKIVTALGSGTALQTNDGSGYVQMVPGADGLDVANVKAMGGINLIGPTTVTGPFVVDGNVSSTGTVMNNGANIGSTHRHEDDGEGELSGYPQ